MSATYEYDFFSSEQTKAFVLRMSNSDLTQTLERSRSIFQGWKIRLGIFDEPDQIEESRFGIVPKMQHGRTALAYVADRRIDLYMYASRFFLQ